MFLICDHKGIIAEICENPAWIKRQSNGVDVLCPEEEATSLYSNDTDSYYPALKSAVSGAAYRLVEVDTVPASVHPGWRYEGGKFSKASFIPTPEESVAAFVKLSLGGIEEDDVKLKVSGLCDDWASDSYEVGDIYNTHAGGSLGSEWDQTWECFQAYDNATYPDIVPGNSAWYTFNRPLHGKSVETARPFVPVQGAHDMYRAGEYMIFTDGKTYRCKSDTNFSPTDYPNAWEVVE